MRPEEQPLSPSLPWRTSSSITMAFVGLLSRGFLYGLSRTETNGLDGFLKLLDQRKDVKGRERGLITVSNHVSVMDDPIIWGILPFRYLISPENMRWSLGSYDICFHNKALSAFFTFGQVLPTHRSLYSKFGGLFQPTITQAVRLLSRGPFIHANDAPEKPNSSLSSPDVSDPFSSDNFTFSTNGSDTFPAPSAYLNRRHSWVHIFPEGKIHQKEDRTMRYFKWGVSRLILESDPCPDIVPIWIEGPEQVMHEARAFPRFIPRPFKKISITFGEKLDVEKVFGDLRDRWKRLHARESEKVMGGKLNVGILTHALKYAEEAVELRKECTMRVREAVLNIRRQRGLPDEDPKVGLVETYREEGGKVEGKMDDGSWVKDT
ncbi:hypothetical protein K432DRAFT_308032 [Lepidopterella palustris CBS 459.81]|uniref:Tafazzin family protein n=1 Tax=Lepidopterella palustris CBS 459.81 TaxID=1314670 RepID=A0A8E2E1S9_9PEZI|nr:hypothetical protein K432DRAFT_308032 [Lepidopterella palustris CBS 459.81]